MEGIIRDLLTVREFSGGELAEDHRSRTYDLRITKASQLQNKYKNEYARDEFLNKKISIR